MLFTASGLILFRIIETIKCFTLNKIVTLYTGMTLRQYIIDLRLRSAIELLQLGQLSISQIASTVGYLDLQSFSRMFKLKMGVSPTLYRDQYIT